MASNAICTSCLRAFRIQARRDLSSSSIKPKPGLLSSTPPKPSAISRARRYSTSPVSHKKVVSHKPPPPAAPATDHLNNDAITNFAAQVRKRETFKSTTEPYIAYGGTEDLFRECNRQCNYTIPSKLQTPPPEESPKNAAGEDIGEGEGWWYQTKDAGGLGLDVTFNNWAQVMFLHMYMLTVRLRCFPAQHAKTWHQNLLDHFFYAAEDRMAVWHGMSSRGVRNKHLKDLWQQWRGILLGYDEGLIKGDAVLATAIWRNVFKARVEADLGDLALVTAYMRSQLRMLEMSGDESIAAGDVRFDDPRSIGRVLARESPQMRESVSETEWKELRGVKSE